MVDSISSYSTSATAGTIQITGLTSDTQWGDVVDQMVELEKYRLTQLENWKSDYESRTTVVTGLDSRLLILETKAEALSTANGFYSRNSTSSDEDILTVTNTRLAVPGAHTITVGENIPHQIASQGWADTESTPIGDSGGDFVIQIGDQGTITISDEDISSDTTLEELCDLINNDPENTGDIAVTASIMEDGSGANPYRLVITADNGGPDYAVSVIRNPTALNFYDSGISFADTDNLSSSTTTITMSGHFTGAKSLLEETGYRTYTFTGPETEHVVGSGDWTVSWTGDNGGGSGSIDLGSSYKPGDTIEIEDGIFIKFDSGTFEGGGKTFTVKAFSTDIDSAEMGSWNGTSSVTSDGNYLGSTNKTFHFTVSGTETYTVGTDSFEVEWTDGEGNSGTIEITDSSYTDLSVFQGVEFSLAEGTVKGGDTFSIKVFNSTIQEAVSEGLAQAEIETHIGFPDSDTTYVTTEDGTFSYTYGGITCTLTVPENSTLSDLCGLINNASDNPGITAMVMDDGSGLSTSCHLQLIGNYTGAQYKIEMISHDLTNFASGGTSGFGFVETQSAQNAMIKVDGYPYDDGEYIQRDTNTISDVISATTLSLMGTGTATISITNDTDAIKTKVQEFVDAINSVFDYIKGMSAHIEEGSDVYNGPMLGNYTFQVIQERITSILTSAVSGISDQSDSFQYASQIGIQTDSGEVRVQDETEKEWVLTTRRWVIDEVELSTALNDNIEAVASFFIDDETTGISGIAELIRQEVDTITDEYSGMLQALSDNYASMIANIDQRIVSEERRITQVEDRLNTKYSEFEALLGELEGQQNALDAILDLYKQED